MSGIEELKDKKALLKSKAFLIENQISKMSTETTDGIDKEIHKLNKQIEEILIETGYDDPRFLISDWSKEKQKASFYDEQIKSLLQEIKSIDKNKDITIKAKELLQATAEAREYDIKSQVEELVSRGLQAVFSRSDYRFTISLVMKRGRLSLEYWWEEEINNQTIKIPITAQSGGVIDVTVMLLRIVFLSLMDNKAKFIALDEPFKHLSAEYLPAVAQLMRELHELLGLQIILITHKEEFTQSADKIFAVRKINSNTKISVM